jgi:hypothetical protein
VSFLSAEFFIQLFVAAFGAGGVSVLVGGWRDKRKADAEAGKEDATAADVIQGTSKRAVEWIDQQLRAVQLELVAEQRKTRDLEEVNRKLIVSIRNHEDWDVEVVREMQTHGITLRPPPRLSLN